VTSSRTYRGTPIRTFRLDDETWDRVRELADRNGVSAGDVVRNAIDAHLSGVSDLSTVRLSA
jgi:predicted DNA-binding protein